jgi:16S rRNA A1518/A1519 N6-dimethyltransferase RsmA/KsgA/DIM1 with predicted DNA glycosylase/AP lyase activity
MELAGLDMMDQHFLTDENVARHLIELAEVSNHDIVLEVGAGYGTITRLLAEAAEKVYAVEKDGELARHLSKMAERYTNIEVIHGDFTRIKIPFFNKVVANPPFQLVEHLITRVLLLNQAPMVLIIPHPLASRLANKSSTLLSLKTNLVYQVELKKVLEPDVYLPPPRRKTSITLFKPKTRIPVEDIMLEMFRQADKKVRNALRTALSKKMPRKQAEKIVELSPLDDRTLERRVARLSLRMALEIMDVADQHFYPRVLEGWTWPR